MGDSSDLACCKAFIAEFQPDALKLYGRAVWFISRFSDSFFDGEGTRSCLDVDLSNYEVYIYLTICGAKFRDEGAIEELKGSFYWPGMAGPDLVAHVARIFILTDAEAEKRLKKAKLL